MASLCHERCFSVGFRGLDVHRDQRALVHGLRVRDGFEPRYGCARLGGPENLDGPESHDGARRDNRGCSRCIVARDPDIRSRLDRIPGPPIPGPRRSLVRSSAHRSRTHTWRIRRERIQAIAQTAIALLCF
jgi:hypothetical protein